MRLDKFISACGAASRRDVKRLIRAGAVTVNGSAVRSADTDIDENADTVALNGKALSYSKFIYLMLNKPSGYISATEDKRLKTVTELIPKEYAHFNAYPAGRLDIDTEGLLILTNNGALAHEITSPKKHVFKKYFARLDRPAEPADTAAFRRGMDLGDFVTKPAVMELTDNPCEVFIYIREGKFHQVKRMCEKCGKTVVYLKRTAIGALELDETLALGEMRPLTSDELTLLKTDNDAASRLPH